MACCRSGQIGEWYFPGDGGLVPPLGISPSLVTFYMNRGDDGTVNLNRPNINVTVPTGQFCCALSDAVSMLHLVCALICELY